MTKLKFIKKASFLNRPLFYWILFVLLTLVANNVAATLVQVEGNALITKTGIGSARQQAIKDAMRQAALQAGARVMSSTELSNSVLTSDNVRVRANGTVKDVVVLDEWINEDEDIYYVLIRAQVTDSDPNSDESGRYRRKIAVTQFNVDDRRQIHDLPGIEIDLAKEFGRRFEDEEKFITVDATRYLLPSSSKPFASSGTLPREAIVQLAESLGVQFIVSGTIRDMGVTKHLFFVQLRHVEIELNVLDGISGAVVATHRMNGSVWEGRPIDFPTSTPAMTDKFFAAPFGQITNKVMIALTKQVSHSIRKLPFLARVLRAQDGKVHFDVGALAQVKVGDVFMAYKLDDNPMLNSTSQHFLGYSESVATALVVKKVQPLFAVGELETQTTRLNAGDVVRFVW